MGTKQFLCLLLIILIPVMVTSPAAVVHGPRSAVYGFSTTFSGYRAFLKLLAAVAILLSLVSALSLISRSNFDGLALALFGSTVPFANSLLPCLRC
jgi:predicted small integral membrane protein